MRANGVPNFPDPKPGGGFRFPASPAPAFAAAESKCQKLLPNGGAPPPFDPQALVQLRQIATCMRHHGIPDFPDPVRAPTTGPSGLPPGANREADYRGVLLAFPATLDTSSPAFEQAATACGGAGILKGL
ncbi:MAG: hypothetical protein ABSG43_25025 [Solirubrobacteraceae bacterium]